MVKPEGIIITMPEKFFAEYPGGEAQFRHIMEAMNHHDTIVWGNTIANIPQHEVLYCYLCFKGFVQYRLNILDYERNVSKQFSDGGIVRVFSNKNWVNLCGPVIPAPRQIPRTGFQGFRYTHLLF